MVNEGMTRESSLGCSSLVGSERRVAQAGCAAPRFGSRRHFGITTLLGVDTQHSTEVLRVNAALGFCPTRPCSRDALSARQGQVDGLLAELTLIGRTCLGVRSPSCPEVYPSDQVSVEARYLRRRYEGVNLRSLFEDKSIVADINRHVRFSCHKCFIARRNESDPYLFAESPSS